MVSQDNSLPPGTIKVLSRTLFIGGIQQYMGEADVQEAIRPVAQVQSIVLHRERRHAFVKVYTRSGAEKAREHIERVNRMGSSPLRARWGVGFGPRDCSDYQSGISIIPIDRLTEADKRWVVEAPYGGTGGTPLVPGVVVEEPDIEVGAGVSSKAISKRVSPTSFRQPSQDDRYGRRDHQRSPPGATGANTMPVGGGGGNGGSQGGGSRSLPPELANLISGLQNQNSSGGSSAPSGGANNSGPGAGPSGGPSGVPPGMPAGMPPGMPMPPMNGQMPFPFDPRQMQSFFQQYQNQNQG